MVDLIEYPSNRVAVDALPRPGDRYEPYGLAVKRQPVMLALMAREGLRCALPYGRLGYSQLESLDGSEGGEARLSVYFDLGHNTGILADIVGFDLGQCFAALANHQLRWIWQLPENQPAVADGSPVVRAIKLRRMDSKDLFAVLGGG